ncbi:hypothetical protein [Parasutterella excrementihominis]|uniref:hypothetical protein n=1 Tax=Parasutterella excrementihominis TaxID=487175 RepID=UPI003569384F
MAYQIGTGGGVRGCSLELSETLLDFGDVNDPQSIISRLLRVKDTVRIRPHLGTEPSLRYVTVQKEGV